MTSEALASIAGTILSLLFSYVPGLSTWYEAQSSQAKAGIMAILLLAVAAGAYGLSCTGQFAYFDCDQAGLWAAVQLFIAALVANQATYLVTRHF